jgi:hypothetical protein
VTDARQSAGLVALAERIELWPIDRLRQYERNPRTHSEAQVHQIAASMIEFGWTNPVLVDEQGGVLAGHGRLLAARKLGLAEVPVIRFEHLSEAQKRAYLIADNQLALQAGWSEELLAAELERRHRDSGCCGRCSCSAMTATTAGASKRSPPGAMLLRRDQTRSLNRLL